MLKYVVKCVLVSSCMLSSLSFARSDECKGLPNFIGSETEFAGCQCGKNLQNLNFTTPAATKVVAACGLRWGLKEKSIDLSKRGVSLNHAYDGDSIFGTIFLSGEIELSGRAEVVQTIASYKIAFYPNKEVV